MKRKPSHFHQKKKKAKSKTSYLNGWTERQRAVWAESSPAVQAEEACCLAWAVEQMRSENSGEKWIRENERRRAVRKVKFLGFWGVLFVLICDCLVVNLLDWICSLSYWYLVCLEDNNIIFGQSFYLEPSSDLPKFLFF